MGAKSFTSSETLGQQASDLAKNYIVDIGNITQVGGSGFGGAGNGGGSGASGIGGENAVSFEGMFSGLDENELQLFDTVLGINYNLSNMAVGAGTKEVMEYAKANNELQKQYETETVAERVLNDYTAPLLLVGGCVLLYLVLKGK